MENIIGRTKTIIKEFTEDGILFNRDFKLFDLFICNGKNTNVHLLITDGEIVRTIAVVKPKSDLSLNFGVGLTGWRGARLELFMPEQEIPYEYDLEDDTKDEEDIEEDEDNEEEIEEEEYQDEGMVYVTANYLEIVGQHYSVWRD